MKKKIVQTKCASKPLPNQPKKNVILLDVSSNNIYAPTLSVHNGGNCSVCNNFYTSCMYKVCTNKYLCGFCYAVKYLNIVDTDTIEMYYSKLSQIEIINKTREYYNANNTVPLPKSIDPNVKQSPISLYELIYLLKDKNTKKYVQEKDYKIFYNNNLSTNFLNTNVSCFSDVFDNDSDDSDNDNSDNDNSDSTNNDKNNTKNNKKSIIQNKNVKDTNYQMIDKYDIPEEETNYLKSIFH